MQEHAKNNRNSRNGRKIVFVAQNDTFPERYDVVLECGHEECIVPNEGMRVLDNHGHKPEVGAKYKCRECEAIQIKKEMGR